MTLILFLLSHPALFLECMCDLGEKWLCCKVKVQRVQVSNLSMRELLTWWKSFLSSVRRWAAELGVRSRLQWNGYRATCVAEKCALQSRRIWKPQARSLYHVKQCTLSPCPTEELCSSESPSLEPIPVTVQGYSDSWSFSDWLKKGC